MIAGASRSIRYSLYVLASDTHPHTNAPNGMGAEGLNKHGHQDGYFSFCSLYMRTN